MAMPTTSTTQKVGKKNPGFNGVDAPQPGNSSNEVIMSENFCGTNAPAKSACALYHPCNSKKGAK
jgi:hypothetical protein